MLNSKSRHWPTGIANSSGQLGRNLCEHLYGISRLWLSSPAPRAAGHAGQHRRLHGRLDAALAESDEPAGGEIHPRLFGLHGRGLWRVPRLLRAARGLWHDFKRDIKRLLSDAHRRAHPGADAAQSRPTTSTSIPTRKTSSAFPQLRFHFQWGPERADDVGALEASDDRSVQGDGRGAVGRRTPNPIAREPACTKRESAGSEMTLRSTSRTSGRRLTMFRISTSATQAFFRILPTRPPRCPLSPSPCAPVITCLAISRKTFTSARDRYERDLSCERNPPWSPPVQ